MSVTTTKDFKYSLHCLSCAYEDLGYNGTQKCLPRTRGCRPVYPYDMMMQSRIRKTDLLSSKSNSNDDLQHTSKQNPEAYKIKRKD